VTAVSPAGRFEVVFICTGNRFRSPLAAALFRRATEGLPVDVRSLGTLEDNGYPALEDAVASARALGLDLSGHRSACINAADLSQADLVLGFELHHAARAVVDAGAVFERTFLIAELVVYLETITPPSHADPVEQARAAVAEAARLRASKQTGALPEIADPYGLPPRETRRIVEEVASRTSRLADLLFPPRYAEIPG
jgi:protein-tyrosine phosphatase